MMLKFIPVRGRKRLSCLCPLHLIIVEIYPREGTETSIASRVPSRSALKFIPVRGRKRHINDQPCAFSR